MQLSNIPAKLVLPFANAGGKSPIPVTSQIGITAGAASLTDGFPPLTRTPIAAGGVPPSGLDMNGILYDMSAVIRWANAGGGYPYDSAFATDSNVNGYPKGARVLRADGSGYWFNTVDGNETDPDGPSGAGWVPDFAGGAATVPMASANVTLTTVQYGKPIIIITGALTADLNLIFPAITFSWIVLNYTTGGHAITGKTLSGVGVVLNSAASVVCDGVDIKRTDSLRDDLASTSAGKGAALVGFQQTGLGSVPRLAQDKMREISVSITDYGGSAAAIGAVNSAAMVSAATALHQRGGGYLDIPPGEFEFDCIDPSAASWDNRFCFRFTVDNIVVRGSGIGITKLKVAAAQNSHMIQFGQRDGGTIAVSNCGVIDLTIDGNRANQTATPDATNNHNSGINLSSGCGGAILRRLHIHDCLYYGIGFQRSGFSNCTVDDVLIERTGADGLDWKDDNADNRGNVANNIRVREFGLLLTITQQGGVNLRGGVKASQIEVTGFSGDAHGIRFDNSENPNPSSLHQFHVAPSTVGTTKGIYINVTDLADDVEISGGRVVGAAIGVDAGARYAQLANITAKNCTTGFKFYQSNQGSNLRAVGCGTGYHFTDDTNVVTNAHAFGCTTGSLFAAGADQNAIRGGVFSGNTTNVTDNGAQTAISHVAGINTHSVGSANVAIDSVGEKTITIPHNLSFAPNLNDVKLTLQRNTTVTDWDMAPPYVYLADGTSVFCKVLVKTASATVGATITLNADCVAKKALRQ